MKKIISLFLLPLLLLIGACQKETFLEEELPSDAVALIEQVIEENAAMGITAGYSKNNTIWEHAAGFSKEDTKTVFTTSTVTRLASIAKPMTAIAIIQLFEKGQLNLDSPIQTYLPEFPIKPEGEITVRHLLNHSSGIPAYKNAEEAENQITYESTEAALDIFKDRDLIATPGTAFKYTTYGYVVLGRIIEKVSGKNYEVYMKENIWEVANMTNTGVESANSFSGNKSELYSRNSKGKIKLATPNNLSNRIPGGGIVSTLEDMMKFGNAVLDHTFISKESLELMFEMPAIENEGSPYGFGWYFYEEIPNYGAVYAHPGGQTGAATLFMMLPEQDFFVVVLSNTSGASDEVLKVAAKLFEIGSNG